MAIGIRSGVPATHVVSGTNPITVTLNGTRQPQASDKLIIVHKNNWYLFSNMPTPTVGGSSSGVNAISGGTFDGGSNALHIKSYTYDVAATGDLTVVITETGTADEEKCLEVWVLGGVDPTTIIEDADVANGSGTSQVAASSNPTSTDDLLICSLINSAGATAYTPPGSMTEAYDLADVSPFIRVTGAYEQLIAAGATGTRTFTAGSAAWAALTLSVKTESGGPPPTLTFVRPLQVPLSRR